MPDETGTQTAGLQVAGCELTTRSFTSAGQFEMTPSRQPGCFGRALVILIFLWIAGVTVLAQLVAWAGPGITGEEHPVSATLWQVGLVGAPLLLLAVLWRSPRERAIFRAWLLAAGYVLALVPGRLFLPAQSQAMLWAQLALSLLFGAALWITTRRTNIPGSADAVTLLAGLASAGLVALPWLALGALGSLLDTLLALALGLTAGLVFGRILAVTWLAALGTESRGRGWDLFTGGLAAAGMLLLAGSGLSFNGVQLLLLLSLPLLGWPAMALSFSADGYNERAPALLVGVSTAAVIALIDSDAMFLLAQDPTLGAAFLAALISAALGGLLAVVALLAFGRWGKPHRLLPAALSAGGLWLIGLLLYFGVGQPGLHGDRLFVILKDQADVSAAANIAEVDVRREFVYRTLVNHADQSQSGLRRLLGVAGIGYRSYYLVNAIEVDSGLLARLIVLTRPEVDRVIPSPILRPLALPSSPDGGEAGLPPPAKPQWNLRNIGADRVWRELGVTGQGVVIGQSDSGVQWDHPEFAARYRGRNGDHNFNWFDPWTHTPAPVDFGGHGTHTLGTVLGDSVGVAPGAEWFACANLQRNLGNPALYLDCMQFMLAPWPQNGDPFTDGDPARAADVLNNSWGCPESHEGCDPESLRPAVRALRAAGIFVVASAGNDGPDCSSVTDPIAIYDESFSVGAVDQNNNLAYFSSVGPVTADGSNRIKPDIVAPGVEVTSAFPGGHYRALDGTSMAGPHVVGVVALMWSANPHLQGNIDRTEQILIQSATPFTGTVSGVLRPDVAVSCLKQTNIGQVPNNLTGYGVVNAYRAVKLAQAEQN